MSCAGNGYLSGNMLIAFPFEDGQFLPWHDEGLANVCQRALQKCFVDARVCLDASSVGTEEWPSVGMFSVSDGILSFEIAACGRSVRVNASASAVRFPIFSGTAPWGSYVIVLSSEAVRAFCESGFTPPVTGISSASWREGPLWLRLCAKCVNLKPVGLNSIRVYDGVGERSAGPHFVLRGDVKVEPGNNMLLSEFEGENGFELNAVPGAGLGRVPCPCSGETVKRFPLMRNDGHVRIFNDTCYDIEPRLGQGQGRQRTGILQIHAKCTACCTCEMYASIVNDRLVQLAEIVRAAKSDIQVNLKDYEQAVAAFNARLENPTLDDVVVSISGMPIGHNVASKLSGDKVKGLMNRCAFTAIVRNASFSTLTVTVYSLSGTDSITELTASCSDADGSAHTISGDTSQVVVGQSFTVYPGRSLVITYVSARNQMVGSVTTGGYTGSISVGISYVSPGGQIGSLGIVSKSVEV